MKALAPNGAKALIFDCDGTLADTMPAHYVAWSKTMTRYGIHFDEDRFYSLGGVPSAKIADMLAKEFGKTLDPIQVAQEKEVEFISQLRHIQPIEAVVKIVHEYRGKRPLAVASGAQRHILKQVLEQIGILDCFDALVGSEDTDRHKPEPDVFLEAARRLNVEPKDCVVYEDTDLGIEAAKRAGMKFVDIRIVHPPKRITPRKS